jgi:hypothetical protein
MEEEKTKTEKKEHKIDITLDEIRYNKSSVAGCTTISFG